MPTIILKFFVFNNVLGSGKKKSSIKIPKLAKDKNSGKKDGDKLLAGSKSSVSTKGQKKSSKPEQSEKSKTEKKQENGKDTVNKNTDTKRQIPSVFGGDNSP